MTTDPKAEMAARTQTALDSFLGSIEPSGLVDWTVNTDVDEQPDPFGEGVRVNRRLTVDVVTYEPRRTA